MLAEEDRPLQPVTWEDPQLSFKSKQDLPAMARQGHELLAGDRILACPGLDLA
jgi:hypothetical protein